MIFGLDTKYDQQNPLNGPVDGIVIETSFHKPDEL